MVVVILGIIVAIAIPRVSGANQNALVNAAATDFRQLELALRMYHADHGAFPPNQPYGDHPPELKLYYPEDRWDTGPALGGVWDWNPSYGPLQPNISMFNFEHDTDLLQRFDDRFDDERLTTGAVQYFEDRHFAWKVVP